MGDLFSGPHIILIALMLLLLFGGKKIPELMKGLGKGIREFKNAKDNVTKEFEDHINNNDQPKINNNATVNDSVNSRPPAVIRENKTA
jgi:sec-independent protein translocase protein TatA